MQRTLLAIAVALPLLLRDAWQLTAPEVSRHLAVMRKAGLLVPQRRGRYVFYSLDASALTAVGTDLLSAVLR